MLCGHVSLFCHPLSEQFRALSRGLFPAPGGRGGPRLLALSLPGPGFLFPEDLGTDLLSVPQWPVSPLAFALSRVKAALVSMATFLEILSLVAGISLFLEPLADLPHHVGLLWVSLIAPAAEQEHGQHFLPHCKPRSRLTVPALLP